MVSFGVNQERSRYPMFGIGVPPAGHQRAQHPGAQAIVQVESMGVSARSQLGRDTRKRPASPETNHPIDVGIVAKQRDMSLLGEHRNTGCRMPEADGAEQWSGQEHVADGAEPHGQDAWRSGMVDHGGKVQRER
jgi:hypothetical protein